MTSQTKERQYKTIPKDVSALGCYEYCHGLLSHWTQILYSRWLVTQAVVLPDIDIGSDDDRSASSLLNEQVEEQLTDRGALERILSRCISPSGKVTFTVKWENGAVTQVTHIYICML